MTTIEQDHAHTSRLDTWKLLQESYDGKTCPKCGDETMPDARDSTIHYCPTCGWRYYPRVNVAEEKQDHKEKTKSYKLEGRRYGECKCPCGVVFLRKSPSQEFHTRACRRDRLNDSLPNDST
jgi:predicted  nucleic acid-binding Zn-ribbon protein